MADGSFWTVQLKDLINVLILVVTCYFVYYAPIKAVKVSREQEQAALVLREKRGIFASLMKTRRFQLDPEHVSSLNLIQVYFHDEDAVLSAYKSYIRLLNRRHIPGVEDNSLFKERDDTFIDLVFQIAKSLDFSQDKKEIEELAYSPEGWANEQDTTKKLRGYLLELLENRRALGITSAIQVDAKSPFPPAPT